MVREGRSEDQPLMLPRRTSLAIGLAVDEPKERRTAWIILGNVWIRRWDYPQYFMEGLDSSCRTSFALNPVVDLPMTSSDEFDDWGTKASFGVLAGMLYGGCKEALASSRFGEVLPPMQAGKDVRTQRFMWREMMEQRLIRITRGSVLGGARLGVFTAIFCGAQWYYAREFDIHNTWNVVCAGSTTSAAFGLALPGSLPSRIRSAALGSVLGAALSLPLGYLQTSLQQQAKEVEAAETTTNNTSTVGGETEVDGITATIRLLERSLSDSQQQSSPDSRKS